MIALPDRTVNTDDVDAQLQFMFLQALADQMSEPALIGVPGTADGSGIIVYVNEAATERLDCSFDALMGKPLPAMDPSARFSVLPAASGASSDRFRASRFGALWARSPADFAGDWRVALFRDSSGVSRYVVYVLADAA